MCFGYAFPFEGNWNFLEYRKDFLLRLFGYAFPFEGNWNACSAKGRCCCWRILWICFPVWRELKRSVGSSSSSSSVFFGYAFPFEGNGNWISAAVSQAANFALWICFPVWREWKPLVFQSGYVQYPLFGYAFPFEGNGNSRLSPSADTPLSLWICFPVWRELKHPVIDRKLAGICFGYAFPFEGNGNSTQIHSQSMLLIFSLDMLSRLKGMETETHTACG